MAEGHEVWDHGVTSPPLFLAPLGIEAFAVGRGAEGADVERLGMGPVKATAARVRIGATIAPRRPVILVGLGGGLVEGLTPGDVVVASSIHVTSGAPAIDLPASYEISTLLAATGLNVHLAPIVSSPKIIKGAEDRLSASRDGAICVDMESYWCAPLAAHHPFAVVRILLDLPEYELFSFRLPRTIGRAWRSMVSSSRALAAWTPTTLNTTAQSEVGEV